MNLTHAPSSPRPVEEVPGRRSRLLGVILAGAGMILNGGIGCGKTGEENPDSTKAEVNSASHPSAKKKEATSGNDLGMEIKIPKNINSKKEAMQVLVNNYNAYLTAYTSNSIENRNQGNEGFVILYNTIRSVLTDEKLKAALPVLTIEDFSDKAIVDKLARIEELLNSEDYYIHIIPKSFEDISYVAMISGKVVSRTEREAQRDDKTAEYEHIVIDLENPEDDVDKYYIFLSEIGSVTYRNQANGPHTVVQQQWAYRQKAADAYDDIIRNPDSHRAMILNEFSKMPEEEAKARLFDGFMRSSLSHEEQHVLDGVPTHQEEIEGDPGERKIDHFYAEVRGSLASVASVAPRIGLATITEQQEGTDQEQQLVAEFVQTLLLSASPDKPMDFLAWPEDKQRELADRVLGVTEPLLSIDHDDQAGTNRVLAAIEAEVQSIRQNF